MRRSENVQPELSGASDVDHLGHSIPHALPPPSSPHPTLSSTLLTKSIGLCFADRSLNASLTFGMRQLFAHVPSLLPSPPSSLFLSRLSAAFLMPFLAFS